MPSQGRGYRASSARPPSANGGQDFAPVALLHLGHQVPVARSVVMGPLDLIEAVKLGNRAWARDLLESGAGVNQQDGQGWTPLSWAAGRGDTAMLLLLLE